MDEPGWIYVTGTAGAGKTTFVREFAGWLKSAGYETTVVNLDPGNEQWTEPPDVDIREWVRLADIMDDYGLGPNGAQVAAADMIALKIFDIKAAIQDLRSDYVLVDTPGQVELFAFRESSRAIVDALGGDRALIAFLYDPALARSPSGFVSLLMLSATVEFRFRLPMVPLLAKADVLTPEQRDEIAAWCEMPDRLHERITDEGATPDLSLSTELLRAIETLGPVLDLVAVSAKDGTGLERCYRAVQRVFGGSEDAEPGQNPADL